MRPAIIFDMDATLCDNAAVRRDPFYRKSLQCLPSEWAMKQYHAAKKTGSAVVVVTNRRLRWRGITEQWLLRHEIIHDEIYMRPTFDMRNNVVVKAMLLSQVKADGYEPYLALEDDPRIVDLWRYHGIPVITPNGSPR